MVRLSLLTTLLTALLLASCKQGDSDAKQLFKFKAQPLAATLEDTKDVAVHLMVEFVVSDETGARVNTSDGSYSLAASVFKQDSFVPVAIVPTGLSLTDAETTTTEDASIYAVPVTLSNATFAFDAIVKVPKDVEAGEKGYSFLFNLVAPEETTALNLAESGTEGTLRSFKTNVQAGTPAADNPVPLNLSTTITSDLIEKLDLPYTQESFDEVLAAVKPVLQSAHEEVDVNTEHKAKPFVQGLVARTLMMLSSDTAKQEALVQAVVKNSGAGIASNNVMSKINKVMSGLAESASKIFTSENDKKPITVFRTEKATQITEKAKTTTFDTVYTPSSVTFEDSDASAAIGGSLVIEPRSAAYAPAGYAVYLGGATKGAATLKLLGKVKVSDGKAVLTLATGTSLEAGLSHFWIYSLAEDDTEMSDLAKTVAITNNIAAASTPAPAAAVQPTLELSSPTSISDGGTVTLAGTCSPSGASISITPPAGFTPTSGSCVCTASTLASCTEFTEGSATSPATFSATITHDSLTATATLAVTITAAEAGEVASQTFGAPFGNYMEDGIQGLCVKPSNTFINCKGSYFVGENDVTLTSGWPSGATIRGYYNLEATTFLDDTSGNVWSVGSSSSTPVGRSTTPTTLNQISFSGLSSGAKLVGISGEHQRASALFDNGQVYSWAGSDSPVERLTSGVHTLPVKYIYDAYGQECFIDNLNDLYCKDSDASSPAFLWTPSVSEKILSNVASLTLAWNAGNPWDGVIKLTSGLIYTFDGSVPTSSTSFTNTGLSVKSSAGNFGFSYGIGDQQFLVVADNGKVYNASGEISGFGSENLAVGASYSGVEGLKHFILSGDGKVYGSASIDMSNPVVFGGYEDVIAIRAFYREFCAIRANGEIRCAGSNAGGSVASPTLMGTMH